MTLRMYRAAEFDLDVKGILVPCLAFGQWTLAMWPAYMLISG